MPKKINNTIILTDDEVVKRITDFIKDTDADELAGVVGDLFGGSCFVEPADDDDPFGSEIVYKFTPNKDYGGEFDDVKGD